MMKKSYMITQNLASVHRRDILLKYKKINKNNYFLLNFQNQNKFFLKKQVVWKNSKKLGLGLGIGTYKNFNAYYCVAQ